MLSVTESAALLCVTPARVRALIVDGILPAHKVGRAWLLREEDVMQRLASHPRGGRPRAASDASNTSKLGISEYDQSSLHEAYAICKESLRSCPSAAEIVKLKDPEEAAFRMAVADFFLQQKQRELIARGVF